MFYYLFNNMLIKILNKIIYIYSLFLSKKFFYKINYWMYLLWLKWLGILNYQNGYISWEKYLISRVLPKYIQDLPEINFIDVGANIGDYSLVLRRYFHNVNILAFEPHPWNFKELMINIQNNNIVPINLGLWNRKWLLDFYDYWNKNSQHATFVKDVIEEVHHQSSQSFSVPIDKLDNYIDEINIQNIDFMKIDTEWFEKEVILGWYKHIKNIKIIQIEFNEMNVYSNTFVKDFYNLLGDTFNFYRLLPNWLLPLAKYSTDLEIFKFQNFVLINKSIDLYKK